MYRIECSIIYSYNMNQVEKFWFCLNDESKKEILENTNYDNFLKSKLVNDEDLENLPKSDYAKIKRAIDKWIKNRN